MRAGGVSVKQGSFATAMIRACPPALQRARIDAGQGAGRGKPGTAGARFPDVAQQDLAIFQAGHVSAPSGKTAMSFFDSISKAAVSANVLAAQVPLQFLDPAP